MIEIKLVKENHKQYLDLLSLADEKTAVQPDDLEHGLLFALYDEKIKAACFLMEIDDGIVQLKYIAVNPVDQRKGYGSMLVAYALHYCRYRFTEMIVDSSCADVTGGFFQKCGFAEAKEDAKRSDSIYLHRLLVDLSKRPLAVSLRIEEPEDQEAVERLTREAFWNVYQPGCDEHYLLHLLRSSPGYLPALHLLALAQGSIVGSIVYSKSKIVTETGREIETLTFGPISIHPEYQRLGVGATLIEHTADLARKLGYRAILIYGSPAYYHRFGFVSASQFGIRMADGTSFDGFMTMELYPGALQGISGNYHPDAVFITYTKQDAEVFDRKYPARVRMKTPTQL